MSALKSPLTKPPYTCCHVNVTGDKSEVLDIDDVDMDKYPLFYQAERYEVFLEPGDILFIPGKTLCWHTN